MGSWFLGWQLNGVQPEAQNVTPSPLRSGPGSEGPGRPAIDCPYRESPNSGSRRMHPPKLLSASLLFLLPMPLLAATYTVGPSGRQYTQLTTLVDSVDLEPGDVVLVDGGATYNGNVVVRSSDRGAPGNPVTFRWNRSTGS